MKTTLEQQVKAIKKVRKMDRWLPIFDVTLKEAAINLNAINLVGFDKVLIAPELIQEVKEMLEAWHAGTLQDVSFRLNKLENILNRLLK